MDEFGFWSAVVLITLIVGAIVASGMFWLSNASERGECDRFQTITGHETFHVSGWSEGCFVVTENGPVYLSQFKNDNGK